MKYFASIGTPLSEALPCGEALEGNPEFENFLAASEGQLPSSYLNFSKSSLDTLGQIKQITALLERSRDLRLLVLAAKYLILSEDLVGFSDSLHAISLLVGERWDHVYPQGQDGDYQLRSAQISSLDDHPRVILPLQSTPLVKDRRLGPIAFRMHLLATGQTKPRRDKEETVPDPNTVRDGLLNSDDLNGLKTSFAAIRQSCAALKNITKQFVDRAGHEQSPSLDKLAPVLNDIEAYLSGILSEREPAPVVVVETEGASETASEPAEQKDGVASDTAFPPPSSVLDASEALKAIATYYQGNEPSSPSLLLIKQAQQLVGKSFVEAMQILAPDIAESSSIKIGGGSPFVLSFAQLKALAGDEAPSAAESTPAQAYAVATRGDALKLMKAVEAFYRKNEPSSPIPLLIERARLFINKDFHSLLKEVVKQEGS